MGGGLIVNGERVVNWFPIWEPVTIEIHEGENVVVFEPGLETHWTCASFAFDSKHPIHLEAPMGPIGAEWAAVRFDRRDQNLTHAVRQAKTWDDLVYSGAEIVPVDDLHASPVVAYNAVWGGHEIDAAPKVSHLERAFSDSSECAVIEPSEGDTEILLDFGKELIGYFDLQLEAHEGVIIDAACFEAIEDGRIHWANGNLCSFRYTTRDGAQRFLSRYRRGFRYAYLVFRHVKEPVKLQSARVLLSTYPDERKGSFACSDPLLNQIWDVGVWTLRMCSEDTFTDCPLYEQTYWVGDGRNEALISYPVWGPTALTRRCARLPGQSLFRSKLTESQVPSGWQNIIPAWSFLWVQLVDEYYQYSGDLRTLGEIYPDVKTMLTNCEAMCTERGLFRISAWNFFDWAGMDIGHETCTHNNLLLAESAKRAACMARALGLNDD
ncbi:MAG: family 78 glycoside hydrolase catalytic domain, partial [Candidatus Hinthialibacter sp.]